MNVNSLDRFVEAQDRTYDLALREVGLGHKRSHWMWFIFPQLRGLGKSRMAYVYGISNLDEAREYLAHPILGERLARICELLLNVGEKSAGDIFGDIDEMKLCSSMTLFAMVSDENSVFHRVLDKFYDGEYDPLTVSLLKK